MELTNKSNDNRHIGVNKGETLLGDCMTGDFYCVTILKPHFSAGFSLEAGNRRTPAATFDISAAYFADVCHSGLWRTLKGYFFI